ncbi:YoaK family protein [Latilactobacillus fuchuensis]|nr:YoaK family protein [Latilactobacillus fuchuensis]
MTERMVLSDKLLYGGLLAAAGGFDSYTYLVHGEVFAGLQTGNLILLGTHLGQMKWGVLLQHMTPVLAFMVGTILTRMLQHRFKAEDSINKRQRIVLGIEVLVLTIVAVISPYVSDLLSSALVSMIAAAQLQEFRQLKGTPFTSLMMTGNVRTLAESLYDGVSKKNPLAIAKAWEIFRIMVSFTLGAVVVGLMVAWLGEHTIIISALCLLGTLTILQLNPQKSI